MTIEQLRTEFEKAFNRPATNIYFCPGRVNLIGEHIDYNGGLVMPCAISMGTTLLLAKNDSNEFRFRGVDFSEKADMAIQPSYTKTGNEWYNYPLGVIHEFLQKGVALEGYDLLFSGNLPIGSGLSSSASIEVLMAHALNELYQPGFSNEELAVLAKRVENDFMGLNSGIMDQFAVAMGKENNAILLNCDTLAYEYLPFEIGDYVLAIINSRKPRKLVESKYNERYSECMTALKQLQQQLPIQHLCELNRADLEANASLIDDPVVLKRARHVVAEQERVIAAKEALKSGDIARFGQLMYASHDSLQHLYEVSGLELDTIVDFCRNFEDCIGARMTGAGFGGCAIALVKTGSFEAFSKAVSTYYSEKTGYAPGVHSSIAAQGVRTIR